MNSKVLARFTNSLATGAGESYCDDHAAPRHNRVSCPSGEHGNCWAIAYGPRATREAKTRAAVATLAPIVTADDAAAVGATVGDADGAR